MSYELTLSDGIEYSGTLTVGRHPDGVLEFEGGVATVGNESVAELIADEYANIEYAGESDTEDEADAEAEDGGGSSESGQTEDDDVEPPFEPAEKTVDEVRDELDGGDYSVAELEALQDAEEAADDRSTAQDAIDDALAEAQE